MLLSEAQHARLTEVSLRPEAIVHICHICNALIAEDLGIAGQRSHHSRGLQEQSSRLSSATLRLEMHSGHLSPSLIDTFSFSM